MHTSVSKQNFFIKRILEFLFSILFWKGTDFLTTFIGRDRLYFKSSFGRPMMETGRSCRIGRWMNPLVSSVTHKRRWRWTTQKMRRHDIIPWLTYWMRTIAHTEGVTKPGTISIKV